MPRFSKSHRVDRHTPLLFPATPPEAQPVPSPTVSPRSIDCVPLAASSLHIPPLTLFGTPYQVPVCHSFMDVLKAFTVTGFNCEGLRDFPDQIQAAVKVLARPLGAAVRGPTGSGKTLIAALKIATVIESGQRVLWLGGSIPLLRQVEEALHQRLPSLVSSSPPSTKVLDGGPRQRAVGHNDTSLAVNFSTYESFLNDLKTGNATITSYAFYVIDEFSNRRGDSALSQVADALKVGFANHPHGAQVLILDATPGETGEIARRNLEAFGLSTNEYIDLQSSRGSKYESGVEWCTLEKDITGPASKLVAYSGRVVEDLIEALDQASFPDLSASRVDGIIESATAAAPLTQRQRHALTRPIPEAYRKGYHLAVPPPELKLLALNKKGELRLPQGELGASTRSVYENDLGVLRRWADQARVAVRVYLKARSREVETDDRGLKREVVRMLAPGEMEQVSSYLSLMAALARQFYPRFPLGKVVSLSNEVGQLRHMWAALTTGGKFAFLNYVMPRLLETRLHEREKLGKWNYKFRLYITSIEVCQAVREVAAGTPYAALERMQSAKDFKKAAIEEARLAYLNSLGRGFSLDHPKEGHLFSWLRLHKPLREGQGAIIIFNDAELAKAYVHRIQRELHLPVGLYTGSAHLRKSEANATREAFNRGELSALCCTTAVVRGLDFSKCSAVFFFTPLPNPIDIKQGSGRAGRATFPGIVRTFAARGTEDQRRFRAGQALVKRMDKEITLLGQEG